jgi:hypothetical protein
MKEFYQSVKVLDNIRDLKNPSEDQIQIVFNLISEEKFARYFFLNLENPVWISPLFQMGYFHKTPYPIEVQPGSFQLPGWPAGEYLARFANLYEEVVIDVIQSTRTENWRVQEILLDALIKISPSKSAEVIYVIDTWLSGRFSDMLPIKLTTLTNHLYDAGLIETAIKIFDSIITPVLSKTKSNFSLYQSNICFRSDHFWVSEYCRKLVPKLMSKDPVNIVSVFEKQLLFAIKLASEVVGGNFERWIGYYWRMDIPNRISEDSIENGPDILIDGLRDGLEEVCKKFPDEGGKFLEAYLLSEHIIFQRIGLYTLRTYGQKYSELVNRSLLTRNYLEIDAYITEYQGLLRDQFKNASEETRKQVIAWIIEGPKDVDKMANQHADWENRATTDDDRRKVREEWSLYYLEIIKDYLSGETCELYNEFIAKYVKPDIEERPHVVTTMWEGTPSPVPADDLASKTFDELKHLFLTFVPKDTFLNPRESLAQTFQVLVHEDPTRYDDFATYLIDPEMRFIYTLRYLNGIQEGVKDKNAKLGDSIISLCEYVVAQKKDSFSDTSGNGELGLFAAQMEVASLLEETLRSDDPYLSREQLDRIRAVLVALAHHENPEKDDDSSETLDPFTRSLNCVRGKAMHGIIQYSLYVIRQLEKLNGENLKAGYLEPEIQEVLDEKLDLIIEPSLAVHSVFGAFTPQLHFLSSEWLEKHLSTIFPEREQEFSYWKAAWDAYIFSSSVHKRIFALLIPHYQRGVCLLAQPQAETKNLGRSPNERLAQHIMFAYLADLTGFGHENQLFDLFFFHAPDPFRANGIFWLSKVLENSKPTADDILWKKCWALWQNRLKIAETQEVSQNTQEISNYMRWLKNSPVGLDVLYHALCQSVKYLNDGFDVRELSSFAAKFCKHSPLEAITLLQMIIQLAKEPWWSPEGEDEEKILRTAMASGKEDAREIALEVINYRGEHGDFRWKSLLD